MKARYYILFLAWSVSWLSMVAHAAEAPADRQSPMVTFQEALYQEETEGNLDKAIELYQQVLDEAAEVERLAARAMYQLGMCHLKKGDETEAAAYFSKLIKTYPKQTSTVKKAQKQLDKIQPEENANGLYDQANQSVWNIIASMYGKACAEAGMKNLYTNSNIYLVNSDFISWYGGYGFYTNTSPEPVSGRVQISTTSYPNQKHYDTMGNLLETEIVPSSNQEYNVYLNLPQELAPGQFYPYAWAKDGSTKLTPIPFTQNQYLFKMQNCPGMHLYEVFYLVIPAGMKLTKPSDEYDVYTIGDFVIFQFAKEVQSNEDHTVSVYLSGSDASEGDSVFKDSFEQGDTTPTDWQTGADVPGVKYLWDRKNGSDGSSSLCMKKNVEKYFPIAQWTRSFEYEDDSKQLSVSAQVRAQKAYKATIDALFLDEKGEWIKHEWVSYIGAKEQGDPPANHNWTDYSGTVDIPENTKQIVIGLQMYGPGTVWFDELKVAYAGGTQLDARQLVEDFFKHNYRDITSRKTLEWGAPQIDDNGNISIRYKYEATIWDKEKKLYDHVFTFDKEGQYISVTDAKPDPLQAENLAAEGWKLWQARKLTEAEDKFQQAVRSDPKNENAWQGLGWAQFNQGKNKNAEVSFKKCIKLNPQNSAALNGLGWIAYADNDKPQAIQWWEKAIKAFPGASAALSGLTKTYMEMEEYDKAVKYYEMWLKAEPNNQDAKDGLQKAKSMM